MRSALYISLVACLLLAATNLNASDEKMDRDTLTNITAIHVVIEDIRSDALQDGLSQEVIRTDVELRLRKAGIVVSDSASFTLYVNANTVKTESDVYAYSCLVQLQQAVRVLSNQAWTIAPTWSTEGTGVVGRNRIETVVRSHVGDLVDQFINAYLSAHQKP